LPCHDKSFNLANTAGACCRAANLAKHGWRLLPGRASAGVGGGPFSVGLAWLVPPILPTGADPL